jgi:hypothetical protein
LALFARRKKSSLADTFAQAGDAYPSGAGLDMTSPEPIAAGNPALKLRREAGQGRELGF